MSVFDKSTVSITAFCWTDVICINASNVAASSSTSTPIPATIPAISITASLLVKLLYTAFCWAGLMDCSIAFNTATSCTLTSCALSFGDCIRPYPAIPGSVGTPSDIIVAKSSTRPANPAPSLLSFTTESTMSLSLASACCVGVWLLTLWTELVIEEKSVTSAAVSITAFCWTDVICINASNVAASSSTSTPIPATIPAISITASLLVKLLYTAFCWAGLMDCSIAFNTATSCTLTSCALSFGDCIRPYPAIPGSVGTPSDIIVAKSSTRPANPAPSLLSFTTESTMSLSLASACCVGVWLLTLWTELVIEEKSVTSVSLLTSIL